MQINFFISHSKEVKLNIAIPIVQVLSNLGFNVWIDRKEIASGDSIYSNIQTAISDSEYCIAIIDSQYLSRPWTLEELNLFHQRELTENSNLIIPIYVGIDKEEVYKKVPWLEGRAFERISNSKFNIDSDLEIICRIAGRFYSDQESESLEEACQTISKYCFPGKETFMILIKDKEYYSTDFRVALIELSNLGGLIYGIYSSLSNQSPNLILDTTWNLSNLLRRFCFNTQYTLTYNMYIALLKSVTAAVSKLKIFLDSN